MPTMNPAEVATFDFYAAAVAQGLIAARYSYSSDQVLAAEVFRITNVMMGERQKHVVSDQHPLANSMPAIVGELPAAATPDE
jgi:hypothetical protein